ncbi:hypothetical protein BH11MYX3_BH11MYX3_17560 [soil metagenome]
MEIPTEISFHELPHSDSVEASIQRWITRLSTVSEQILRCRVFVMQPHRRHRTGKDFEIHLHLSIRGSEITASRIHHEDIYVAIADAFRAARRQLLEHGDMRTGHGRQQLSAYSSPSRARSSRPARRLFCAIPRSASFFRRVFRLRPRISAALS